ncbi:MAG: ROK family protein [Acidimicrobiia bacterium]|nr:ROK family protein [Acidimicrobiia bacterium]
MVELAGGDPEDVRGEHVGAAAREGDPDAVAVLQEFAYWVALGLANLVNLLDPEVVVVGGGLVAVADLFLPEVRRAFDELVFAAEQRPALRIEAARVGEEAGALGAALLAAERQRGSASHAR